MLNRKLRKDFVLLAPDRPGYGENSPGKALPELAYEALPLREQLRSLEERFPRRRIYALGWGYGRYWHGSRMIAALLTERFLSPHRPARSTKNFGGLTPRLEFHSATELGFSAPRGQKGQYLSNSGRRSRNYINEIVLIQKILAG